MTTAAAMSFALQEILTLVGRLDDGPGFDTPRERFRRFLTERLTDVAGVRALLAQCQQGLGDQPARARHDLIVLLGVFLGFEVSFGGYEPPAGPPHLSGHWRSRRRARIVLDVRSEQTAGADVDELSRVVAELAANTPPDLDERWVGLCVTTPFYAARRHLESLLAQRPSSDIRCVSVESLLWLADMVSADRLTHNDVLRLLTSGPDSDFTIDLMRRMATGGASMPPESRETSGPPQPSQPVQAESAGPLSIVDRSERRGRETDFWLASLVADETSSPEQLLDFVIRGRQLLGVSDSGPFPMPVHEGDWVCFYIAGTGIVGHAQFAGLIPDASTVIRDAGRFTAVFQLKNVSIYDAPNRVSIESLGLQIPGRMPYDDGAVLAPISRRDYEALTSGNPGGSPRPRFGARD